MEEQIPKELEEKIDQAVTIEREFIQQMKLVSEIEKDAKKFWKEVETAMINAGVKNFKGDWGSITIAKRLAWNIDLTKLPKKFIKKDADTKKLSDTYKLENKPIAGAEPRYSEYLTKRIK